MDDKTIEALFREIKMSETPDMWPRIEAGLAQAAGEMSAATPGSGDVTGQARAAVQTAADAAQGRAPVDSDHAAASAATATQTAADDVQATATSDSDHAAQCVPEDCRDCPRRQQRSQKVRRYMRVILAAAACLIILMIPLRFLLSRSGGSLSVADLNNQIASMAENGGAVPSDENMISGEEGYDGMTSMEEEAGYGGEYQMADAGGMSGSSPSGEMTGEMPSADPEAPKTEADAGEQQNVAEGRKLIRTVSINMETLDFDRTLADLRQAVSDCGGYFETSSIDGNSTYDGSSRYGSFVVRVPSDELDAFLERTGGIGNILHRSEETEDITLKYVDTQSHIEALEAERDRLMELMEQAESMEDILAIESELTNIRYALENYQSMMKQYDNLIDYSTVELNIDEVREETPVEELTIWQRIGMRFRKTIENISEGGQDLVVWLVASIPYFIIIAVAVVIVIVVVRKVWRRKK